MKKEKIKKFRNVFRIDLLIAIAIAFLAGFIIKSMIANEPETMTRQASAEQAEQTWTCSMHPQIRQPKPGKCPICFMDLIPVTDGQTASAGAGQISFSENALALMQLQTVPVQRKYVEAEIRMVGKIDYDETRLEAVTAWVPGRIERMYVDFEGTRVIKGDHMFTLYSPDLISAQAEYLQTLKAADALHENTSQVIERSTRATLQAARDKLELLGLTEQQIADIRNSGQPTEYITINAPRDGIVIERHAAEGGYVNTGTPIYTIADLSRLWVRLDAYESDMQWLRYGQQVEFTVEAYPGQMFKGRITFIPPAVNPNTRTVKLRVDVDNPDGKLKPNMFVRALVRSAIAEGGHVVDADIAGKWICPMHPSVIKDAPDQCDICGMDLVRADTLRYVEAKPPAEPPLVIPTTAPLITGKRAVVYVQVPDTEKPTFEGREVVLGPQAGDYYLVEEGLAEGEHVVVNGNFKIDAALQIQAKPSMMSPPEPIPTQSMQLPADPNTPPGEQTQCPVMGGPINKDYFIEYQGEKVYFCCPGCDELFLDNPEQYLDKLPQFQNKSKGQTHED